MQCSMIHDRQLVSSCTSQGLIFYLFYFRILSCDPGIAAYDSSYLEEAGCKDFVEAIYPSEVLRKSSFK